MPEKHTPLQHAHLSFIDSTPYAENFGDVYYSKQDGLAESSYVFLQHNQLKERWQKLNPHISSQFIIAETGFGTGLNFLLCRQLWNQYAPKNWTLYFLSVEKYPLSASQLTQSLSSFKSLQEDIQELLSQYPCPSPGLHALDFEQVNLQLYIGDIGEALMQWLPYHPDNLENTTISVDAWFLDGFAPAKNPQMWCKSLFQHMVIHSKASTTFATFTAAGDVRRGLQEVGFKVSKGKGFGHKRDMLYGVLEQRNINISWYKKPPDNNWYSYKHKTFNNKTALVIGAGLAGCHSAYALAKSGWSVTLIEQESIIACAASGNRQSILYTRLGWPSDYLTQFNLSAFQYALRHYQQFFATQLSESKKYGALCGVLQLAYNNKEALRLNNVAQAFAAHSHFCQWLTPHQASNIAGIELEYPALFFPQAGWINPQTYCQQLISHPQIKLITHTQIEDLHFDTQWHAHNSTKNFSADIAIICNSTAAKSFNHCQHYPLKNIRGQVSHWPASQHSQQLQTVICHQGYIAPAVNKHHDIGATFTLKNDSTHVLAQDHVENWQILQKHIPHLSTHLEISMHAQQQLQGRTGFRCSTNDYLPIIGQVLDTQKTLHNFSDLRKRAHKHITAQDIGLNGLFVNIAHGSRGLTSTPFAAAHIASLANNTASCISQKMQLDLHPGRFLIRDLRKEKS